MSIDPVRKPPGADKAVDATATGKAGAFQKVLGTDSGERTEGSESAKLIDRLERGEIDVEQYLQTRVDQSVLHLEPVLSSEQLEFVKQRLHEQLRTDPVLVELTRRATAATPAELNK